MAKKGMEQALMNPQEKKLKVAAMNVIAGNPEKPSEEGPAAVPESSADQKPKKSKKAESQKETKSAGRTGKTARIDLRVKEDVKADLVALAALNDMSVTEYIEHLTEIEKKKNRRKLAKVETA